MKEPPVLEVPLYTFQRFPTLCVQSCDLNNSEAFQRKHPTEGGHSQGWLLRPPHVPIGDRANI